MNKKNNLVINYFIDTRLKSERFQNVSDPHKVISKRNALNIKSAFYNGREINIEHHKKLYKKAV